NPAQRWPVDVLQGDIAHPFVLAHVVHGCDSGMMQPGDRLSLALESSKVRRSIEGGAEDLERDKSVERQLACQVDDAHTAASQSFLDSKTADVQIRFEVLPVHGLDLTQRTNLFAIFILEERSDDVD